MSADLPSSAVPPPPAGEEPPGAAVARTDQRADRDHGLEVRMVVPLLLLALAWPSLHERYGGPTPYRIGLRVVVVWGVGMGALLVLRWWWRSGLGPRGIGVRADGLGAALRAVAPWTALALAGLVAGALAWGLEPQLLVRPKLVREVLRYPLWALVQQGLVLGFVHRRLCSAGWSDWNATFAAAAFYSAMHAPNASLCVLTGVMGIIWGRAWVRHGNLVAIALSHALLGLVADEVFDLDLHVGLNYWERLAYRAGL